MPDFVSEPIEPADTHFDTAAMGRGEPGLPRSFRWRDRHYVIEEIVRCWKKSSREGGTPDGELYLRRYHYELRMDDGSLWNVYFQLNVKRGLGKPRWFLFTREEAENGPGNT